MTADLNAPGLPAAPETALARWQAAITPGAKGVNVTTTDEALTAWRRAIRGPAGHKTPEELRAASAPNVDSLGASESSRVKQAQRWLDVARGTNPCAFVL